MATVQVRVEDDLRNRVGSLYASLGIDTATAVRMFFYASLECGGIPFDVRHRQDMSLETAVRDARNHTNLHGPFDSAADAVRSMLEDDEPC